MDEEHDGQRARHVRPDDGRRLGAAPDLLGDDLRRAVAALLTRAGAAASRERGRRGEQDEPPHAGPISRATICPLSITSGSPPPGCVVPPARHSPRVPRTALGGRLSVPSRPWGASP